MLCDGVVDVVYGVGPVYVMSLLLLVLLGVDVVGTVHVIAVVGVGIVYGNVILVVSIAWC